MSSAGSPPDGRRDPADSRGPAGRCSTVTPGARMALAGCAGEPLGAYRVTWCPRRPSASAREVTRWLGPAASCGRGELDCEATRAILITSLLRAAVGDRRDHAGSAGEEGRGGQQKGTPQTFTPYGREGVPAS